MFINVERTRNPDFPNKPKLDFQECIICFVFSWWNPKNIICAEEIPKVQCSIIQTLELLSWISLEFYENDRVIMLSAANHQNFFKILVKPFCQNFEYRMKKTSSVFPLFLIYTSLKLFTSFWNLVQHQLLSKSCVQHSKAVLLLASVCKILGQV